MPLQQTDIQREREEFQFVYTVSRIVIHKSSVNCTSDDLKKRGIVFMFFYFCHQKFGSHMKMCC